MKDKQLQTKRKTKTGFRKLHAKATSGRRKQRVSAAANADMLDSDVPNASIGRALTVILLLHVVAIGVIYIGIQWNKGEFDSALVIVSPSETSAVDIGNVNADLPTEFVLAGDTYTSFASRHQVDEAELRRVNNNATIHAGKPLSIPPAKVTASASAVAVNLPVSDRPALPASNNVVNIANVKAAPKAQVVNSNIPKAQLVVEAGSQTYKVQPGDSVWRISHKYKVSQDALMQLNGMKDARHLRSGMTLKIPAN